MRNCAALLCLLIFAACSSREATQPLVADQPPAVVYVTPTAVPTLVPTMVRFSPTSTPSIPTEQPESDSQIDADSCQGALDQIYTAASDHCLTGPTGTFCSGGIPPAVEPSSDALNQPGALAEAERIVSLRSPALSYADGGGLVWLRLEEDILMDALLVGEVELSNRASPSGDLASWRSFTIESGETLSDCETLPALGALVVQGLYGQSARLTINGVGMTINGTLIAVTQGEFTKFIAIEGEVLLIAFGQSFSLNVGQQLNIRYAADDWTRPVQLPNAPALLDYELIEHLPVVLFDRAVPIPQPGYAQTQGGVNMRTAPDINARLLFQVPAGETMSVLGISSDREWLHIRLGNGETGWMSAELLARNLGQVLKVYDLTPQPPQRFGKHAGSATVNVAAGGNLREAPDTAFRVKRTLPFGMALQLVARSPYSPWVKVKAGDDIGWMALFTLSTESVISSLPIDYDVPLPARATSTPSFSFGGGHAYPDPEGGF